MKKISIFFLAVVLIFSLTVPVSALGDESALDNLSARQNVVPGIADDIPSLMPDSIPNNNNLIIGQAGQQEALQSSTPKTFGVSTITVETVLFSASQAIITLVNTGTNTIDMVYGSVFTGTRSVDFATYNLFANTTRTLYVNIPMLLCHENMSVAVYFYDELSTYGPLIQTGARDVPSNLTSYWVQGSFTSVQACINYHFNTHGAEVACTNIMEYATLASYYRDQMVYQLYNLTPLEIYQMFTITASSSTSTTLAHKYKYNYGTRYYCILSDAGMWLVSYGI